MKERLVRMGGVKEAKEIIEREIEEEEEEEEEEEDNDGRWASFLTSTPRQPATVSHPLTEPEASDSADQVQTTSPVEANFSGTRCLSVAFQIFDLVGHYQGTAKLVITI